MANVTLNATNSFYSSAQVPIESLRVYFQPKQEGSGDPSPINIRNISGWNGLTVRMDDISIPNDYQRVEYLASSGTQYIKTGVMPSNDIGFDCTFWTDNALSTTSYGCIFGGRKLSQNNDLQLTSYSPSSAYKGCLRYGTKQYSAGIQREVKQTVSLRNRVYTNSFEDKITIDSQTWNDTYEIYLFGLNNGNSLTQSGNGCKIYGIKFYNGNTLIKHFVPCIRNSDDKPGMYETVNGSFYVNQGTGEFTYGEVCGKTYNITFPGIGKNLFGGEIEQGTILQTNGTNVGSSARVRTKDYLFLKGGKTYTISAVGVGAVMVFRYNLNKEYVDGSQAFFPNLPYTITLADDYYIRLAFRKSSNNEDITPADISNIQIEEGQSATTYEAFNNTIYGGYIDLIKGELKATMSLQEFTWGGTYDNNHVYDNVEIRRFTTSQSVLNTDGTKGNTISSVATWRYAYNYDGTHFYTIKGSGGSYMYMALPNDTSEDFKFLVCYDLSTPITYPLATTEIKTFLGSNCFSSNAEQNVEIDYALHDTRAIQAAKRRIIANAPHIISGSSTFKTDVRANLLDCEVGFTGIQNGSGNVSPSNIRNISGWSGVNIYQLKNNLLDITKKYQASTTQVTIGQSTGRSNWEISLKAGTYIITTTTSVSASVYIAQKNGSVASYSLGSTNTSIIFTLDEDGEYEFFIYKQDGFTVEQITDFQLEKGDTHTTYTTTTYPFDWSLTAGTLGAGTFNPITGVLTETWKIFEPTSSLSWSNATDYFVAYNVLKDYKPTLVNAGQTNKQLVSHYKNTSWSWAGSICVNASGHLMVGKNFAADIGITMSDATAIDDFKDWLDTQANNGTPLQLYYELLTPTTYQLTPQSIKTISGQNNIVSNANGAITTKYWGH